MTLDETSLGSFGSLARAIGLMSASGANGAWFSDPMGGSTTNASGLKTVLSSDDQRDALISFVDEVLGPPALHQDGDQRWIPLFAETDPHVTVYAVVEPVAGAVRVGVGVEHVAGTDATHVTTTLHVPIFHVPRDGADSRPSDGSQPSWLLLGRPGGRIFVSVDAQLDPGPPTPGQAFLGGGLVSMAIPTSEHDTAEFVLTLRDLQLPGATVPTSRTLDVTALADLGPDVFEFVVGLVRQQIDSLDLTNDALRHIRGLAGILGLADVPDLPPLPIADLPQLGISALVAWLESVLNDDAALDAWLGSLASLVGATVRPADNAVAFTLGSASLLLGLRVTPGTGGHPVLVPWLEILWSPADGADLTASVDLLRADTSTGVVTAVPALQLSAVIGAQATHGADILTGTPGVGTVRVGLTLDAARRPAFALLLYDVHLPGGDHAVVDLSSPQAALDAVGDAVANALSLALQGFGDVGTLIEELLGLTPPAGVQQIEVAALFSDPVGALRGYWLDLLAADAAIASVLGTLGHLLTGATAALPGAGTAASPWTVALPADVELRFVRDGTVLQLAIGANVVTPVPGDLAVSFGAELTLLRADLHTGHLSLASAASARLLLRPAGAAPVTLDLEVATLRLLGVGIEVGWVPGGGLRVTLVGDGLALSFVDPHSQLPVSHDIALPTIAADGSVSFTPDWDALEGIVTALLSRAGADVVLTVLDLLGWRGNGAHLRLAALIADPGDAVAAWATAMALDCAHLQAALGPVAWLLSGGGRYAPFGAGQPDDHYRCPIAGEVRAPGLAAWTVPGCPPSRTSRGTDPGRIADLVDGIAVPSGPAVALALSRAADLLPGLADLLEGRQHLGAGLTSLIARWTGTDGVVGSPTTVPSDVTSVVLGGFSYAELVAAGRLRTYLLDQVTQLLDTVVHVGCASDWLTGPPPAACVDATVAVPAPIGPAATGDWFVRVSAPSAAAGLRTDHDAVQAQAGQLAAALAGRTSPVVLVAYGAAGAAAIRAAAGQPLVSAVVTVGTPWSPVSVLALTEGLGGDALRLLARLLPDPLPTVTDRVLVSGATPALRGWGLVGHSREVTGPADLPSAGAETRRAGLPVYAVFGSLSTDDAAKAVAALVVSGVEARSAAADAAARATSGPPVETHVGVDLPVLDLDLGGLFVGVGAVLDLVSVNATNPHVRPLREVVVSVRIGVTDGWLLGGPGAVQGDFELRWVEARIHVPLDGRTGSAELVLHDPRAFTADRETWLVNAGGVGAGATTALPEVKILLSEMAARLTAASPDLAHLLTLLGVLRSSGLDGDAIDHLLYDPVATIRPLVASQAASVAASLRLLIGLPTAGLAPTAFRVGFGAFTIDVDLASAAVTGSVRLGGDGWPPLSVDVTVSQTSVAATVALGAIDPSAGGVRLVGAAGTGGATLAVETRAPGATATTTVGIYPTVDTAGLTGLARTALPAVVLQAVAEHCRTLTDEVSVLVIDSALDAIGMLGAPDAGGYRDVTLPYGLLSDPGAWLRLRGDPFGAVVAVMEALAPVVVPGRAAGAHGWPLSDELTVSYAVAGGRLELSASVNLSATIDSRVIATALTGGLSLSSSFAVQPIADASVLVDQTGLRLAVSSTPTLDLVRAAPAAAIRLYPPGGGVGAAVEAAAESAVRLILNALVDHADDATATTVTSVGLAMRELGTGLDLLVDGHYTDAKITTFAQDPAAALLARLPQLVVSGVGALTAAIDPGGTKVVAQPAAAGKLRLTFGTAGLLYVELDGVTPAIEIGCSVDLVDRDHHAMGHLAVDKLRLTTHGIELDVRAGPFAIDVGPLTLFPVLVARIATTSGGISRLFGIGVGLDLAGEQSVEFRWTMDAHPPAVTAVTRDVHGLETSAVTDLEQVGLQALGLAVSLATSVLSAQLGTVITDRATGMLQDVVFTGGGRTLDPQFFADLAHPEALLRRAKSLAWNCAVDPHHGAQPAKPISLTIDDTVTVGLTAVDLGGGQQHIGLDVSLVPGTSFDFPTSDVKVALEVDASWIDPAVTAGLSILVLKGPDLDHLEIVPGFSVAGVGLHFSKSSGPLLELGSIALDGIAFSVYAEGGPLGAGGGAKIQLDGLAVAPGGGSGGGVANNIMNDVGTASANNRPVFSPSVAVQKHPGPGQGVGMTLRAGDPPGPWWIVIQRQLGPLYVDRIGFNSVENGGKVTEISLLFSGQLSLFGLTAAVDELMIKWNGGDVLSIGSWSVDLMGLAIAADMAGVSLTGGLLKTQDGDTTSYVGMLIGRFATYGLSVFGGYTSDGGHASFFLFGAINGPIGGPPAFFVTGLGGGLGINRGLVIPDDISKFGTYPFIQALDPAAKPPAKPMDELHALSAYFPVEMGNFWFAAGVSFTCFALVDGVAVIAVSFGNGLDIDLLGIARMALPRPGAALVSIELALLARFSTSEGLFMIKAQLTDNSWLLYEDVRLTGGFAFCIWWKGPLAGQFVVTMGGYHPSFHRDGYPDVPRLGIMWRISDALVIKGGSYFALTSEAVMAGVSIEASLDLGWVWAKVSFGADGIVYFDPFWYEVSAYARISAGIHLDLGFFSISLSVTLGATIKVWGPDFAGLVEFEIGPCTVPVSFGSNRKVAGALLLWPEFVAKYLEDAGGGVARAISSITGKGSLPSSTGGQTAAPSADGSSTRPFQVFAEFGITFTTTVPTTAYDVGTGAVAVPTTVSGGQPSLLGLSPIGASHVASTLTVRLDWYNPATKAYQRLDAGLARLVENFGASPDGPGYVSDFYPLGVWGTPQDPTIPVKPLPKGDVLSAGKTLALVAGVDMPQVGPDIDYHQVKVGTRRPLPLSATGTEREVILDTAAGLPAVDPSSAGNALTLAAQQLFADRTIDTVVVARGGHSALAQAAFVQDRTGPPLFGTLTDGLAKVNGAAGSGTPIAPVSPYQPRDLRPAFVAGYLTGGVGAVQRPSGTTVADGRLKRRPAPTVDSVHGRLALHVPTTLMRSSAPTAVANGTLVGTAAPPRTEAPGSTRSYVGARVGSVALQRLLTGLPVASSARRSRAAQADASATVLRTGDLVVLQLPDAAIDVEVDRRPSLAIKGSARVTAVLGRTVLYDADVADATVQIPRGASHVAVQADGLAEPTGGWAGWHDRSRVARVGAQSALAAGCVVSADATGGAAVLQWDTAGAVVHAAAEVTTRFARTVTTVAIALAGAPAASLTPTQLHLVGATVATDAAGKDLLPIAVSLGDTSVLVYQVVPDKGAATVSVTVAAGADWVVSGCLGASEPAADVAAAIARRRLSGVVAKLLALSGPGCQIGWQGAPAAAKPRTRRARR